MNDVAREHIEREHAPLTPQSQAAKAEPLKEHEMPARTSHIEVADDGE